MKQRHSFFKYFSSINMSLILKKITVTPLVTSVIIFVYENYALPFTYSKRKGPRKGTWPCVTFLPGHAYWTSYEYTAFGSWSSGEVWHPQDHFPMTNNSYYSNTSVSRGAKECMKWSKLVVSMLPVDLTQGFTNWGAYFNWNKQ